MSNFKHSNGRTELTPKKERVGNVSPGVASDELTVVSQTVLLSADNTISGTNTFSGANTFTGIITFSGNNTHSGSETFSGAIISSLTTDSSGTTTGAIKTAGGLGVAKNAQIGGQLVVNKNVIKTLTPYTAGTDSTAGWTLTEVKTGLVAGCIKSTTAAAVTLTLDSVANIITAFGTAGVTLTTGSLIEFVTDNSQGANGLTLAVDSGATIAVATPVLTGGATLTCSTANKLARYQLYLTSTTTAILSRLV